MNTELRSLELIEPKCNVENGKVMSNNLKVVENGLKEVADFVNNADFTDDDTIKMGGIAAANLNKFEKLAASAMDDLAKSNKSIADAIDDIVKYKNKSRELRLDLKKRLSEAKQKKIDELVNKYFIISVENIAEKGVLLGESKLCNLRIENELKASIKGLKTFTSMEAILQDKSKQINDSLKTLSDNITLNRDILKEANIGNLGDRLQLSQPPFWFSTEIDSIKAQIAEREKLAREQEKARAEQEKARVEQEKARSAEVEPNNIHGQEASPITPPPATPKAPPPLANELRLLLPMDADMMNDYLIANKGIKFRVTITRL